MLDINTVGAGGGSIAWFDRDGLLKVGPQSAGARSGPGLLRAAAARSRHRHRRQPRARPPVGAGPARRRHDARSDALARAAIAPLAERLGFTIERTALGMHRASWSPTWCARSARSRSSAGTIRATLRCCRSAAPGRCTPATSRRASAFRRFLVPARTGHPLRAGPRRLRPARKTSCARPVTPLDEARLCGASARASIELRRHADAWFAREGVARSDRNDRDRRSTCAMSGRTSSCAVPLGSADPAYCRELPTSTSLPRGSSRAHEQRLRLSQPRRPDRDRQLPPDRARGSCASSAARRAQTRKARKRASRVEHRPVWFAIRRGRRHADL